MSDFDNGLTKAELERLAYLSEELGEVIQIIGKIIRHGYESTHPDGGPINRELLEKEIIDVYSGLRLMFYYGDIDELWIKEKSIEKDLRKNIYFHHQD